MRAPRCMFSKRMHVIFHTTTACSVIRTGATLCSRLVLNYINQVRRDSRIMAIASISPHSPRHLVTNQLKKRCAPQYLRCVQKKECLPIRTRVQVHFSTCHSFLQKNMQKLLTSPENLMQKRRNSCDRGRGNSRTVRTKSLADSCLNILNFREDMYAGLSVSLQNTRSQSLITVVHAQKTLRNSRAICRTQLEKYSAFILKEKLNMSARLENNFLKVIHTFYFIVAQKVLYAR